MLSISGSSLSVGIIIWNSPDIMLWILLSLKSNLVAKQLNILCYLISFPPSSFAQTEENVSLLAFLRTVSSQPPVYFIKSR